MRIHVCWDTRALDDGGPLAGAAAIVAWAGANPATAG